MMILYLGGQSPKDRLFNDCLICFRVYQSFPDVFKAENIFL